MKKELEDIIKILKQADATNDLIIANRYIKKARNLAMKNSVRIPSEWRKKFCKHCYSYLKQGVNCRVRTKSGKLIYTCNECNKITRYDLQFHP